MALGRSPTITWSLEDDLVEPENLEVLDFPTCLYHVYRIGVDAVKATRSGNIESLLLIDGVLERALPRLQRKTECRSIQDRVEFYALRIHQNLMVGSLIRHMLQGLDKEEWRKRRLELLTRFRISCATVLEAFLDMQALSIMPLRSWTFLHGALSSALFLGLISERDGNGVGRLPGRLLEILSRLEEEAVEEVHSSDTHIVLSRRWPRIIAELKRLCQSAADTGALQGDGVETEEREAM